MNFGLFNFQSDPLKYILRVFELLHKFNLIFSSNTFWLDAQTFSLKRTKSLNISFSSEYLINSYFIYLS